MIKRIVAAVAAVIVTAGTLVGCASDADVVSQNISTAAEQFEVNRRIVAFNGITDKYLMVIEGRCSLEWPDGTRADVICKLENGSYVKHTIHLSDNVSVMSEQTNGTEASTDQYRVIFKPEVLVPNVDRP